MKIIVRAVIQSGAVIFGTYAVYRLDPTGTSKMHGPMLTALAFIFVLQDSLFWLCHRKLDDFLLSEGLSPSELLGAESRVKALKRHARRLWLQTLVLRSAALIIGIVLTYSTVVGKERIAIFLIGYFSVFAGLLLTMKTYAVYQHADEEHAKRQVIAREQKTREESAAAIRANNPGDWHENPDLTGYGPRIRVKPR